jgi:hypothetical protein
MSLEAAFKTVQTSLGELEKLVANKGDDSPTDIGAQIDKVKGELQALGKLDPVLAKIIDDAEKAAAAEKDEAEKAKAAADKEADDAEKAKADADKEETDKAGFPGGAPPFKPGGKPGGGNGGKPGDDEDEEEKGKGKAAQAKSIDDVINEPGAWPRDMAAIKKNVDEDYDFGPDPWTATK